MLIFYCISHVRSKNLLNNSNKYQQIRVYWLNAVANRRIYAASLRICIHDVAAQHCYVTERRGRRFEIMTSNRKSDSISRRVFT